MRRPWLYDGYVDLFFNREAEKSSIVRDQRDILINLHGYLAWVLHCEAEKSSHRGAIGQKRLEALLGEYLELERRGDSSISELFTGMVERIVFLVSRVEGTYEFEVQPLREYFAARYLYETAPYSPPGAERRGTKPDRFDAIARNPYWLNVTRFYAGCFSKGELACLVDRLQDLAEGEESDFTDHARLTTALLLSDWVFSQDQRATGEAAALVVAGRGFDCLLGGMTPYSSYSHDPLVLAPDCGREQLISACRDILSTSDHRDRSSEAAHLLRVNANEEELCDIWMSLSKTTSVDLTRWLRCGLRLGVLHSCSRSTLDKSLAGMHVTAEQIGVLLDASISSYIEDIPELRTSALQGMLNGDITTSYLNASGVLARFSASLQGDMYWTAFQFPQPTPLKEVMTRNYRYDLSPSKTHSEEVLLGNEGMQPYAEAVALVDAEMNRSAAEWATSLSPWNSIVERFRRILGDGFANYQLANLAACITSKEATCSGCSDLLDIAAPLCDRVRYARLRPSSHNWWRRQMSSVKSAGDALLVALIFSTWASSATIITLLTPFQSVLSRLTPEQRYLIARAVRQTRTWCPPRSLGRLDTSSLDSGVSADTVASLGRRLSLQDAGALYLRHLADYDGSEPAATDFCIEAAAFVAVNQPGSWHHVLSMLKLQYTRCLPLDIRFLFAGRPGGLEQMPLDVAKEIAGHESEYPLAAVYLAEARCRIEAMSHIEPVSDIALREGWFPA